MKISIIIPCYNVEKYIDRCLTSVIGQSIGLEKIEIICVNDASTDGTLSILKKWESDYPDSIILVDLPENQKLGRARNIGMTFANGEYVVFVDSDDWLDSRFIEVCLSAAKAYDVPMVRCDHIRDYTHPDDTSFSSIVKGSDIPCRICHIETEEDRRNSIRIMSQNLTAWGKLIRKDFLIENNIYFAEGLAYEDNLWGPLLYIYLTDYAVIDLPLYHYYVNDESLSLKMNAPHHPDFLEVQLLKWNELFNRGFTDRYYDEISYDFLHSCYLDFFKLICVRYEPPSYALFQVMSNIIKEYIPDYSSNPYIEQGFTEFQKILIKLIEVNPDEKTFLEFAEYVRKLGV